MIMLRPLSFANTRSTARRSASSKSKLIGCPTYCLGPVPGTANVDCGCAGAVGCAGGWLGAAVVVRAAGAAAGAEAGAGLLTTGADAGLADRGAAGSLGVIASA